MRTGRSSGRSRWLTGAGRGSWSTWSPTTPRLCKISYDSSAGRVSGIDVERQGLFSGTRGRQIAGRFTLIPTSAFTPGQEGSALIAALEASLRLYRHKDGALVTLADYLHRRTRGMIGSLLWLIRDAACQAILDGTEKITRKSLDQIAIDMTAQAPPPRTGAAKR